MAVCQEAGYQIELSFPHWLAQIFDRQPGSASFVDIIFNSGNGLCPVDDEWFAHATCAEVMGVPVKLIPPEENIWSKAFVMERERFDGADVVHLIHRFGATMDWTRLVRRFGPHWRILLAQLVLYGFVYPSERVRVPAHVTRELLDRMERELIAPDPVKTVCQGTLLSRSQYLADIDLGGYADARIEPLGKMTPEQIALWTKASTGEHPEQNSPHASSPSHGTVPAPRLAP